MGREIERLGGKDPAKQTKHMTDFVRDKTGQANRKIRQVKG